MIVPVSTDNKYEESQPSFTSYLKLQCRNCPTLHKAVYYVLHMQYNENLAERES